MSDSTWREPTALNSEPRGWADTGRYANSDGSPLLTQCSLLDSAGAAV
jgi:hypothetical protein